MSNSENGARSLREKGAESEVTNALDENAILNVLKRVGPDAVIEELTSMPKRYTPEEMRAAGAKRYIVQSTGFFYGPGQGLATEKDALAVNASPGVAGSVGTYRQIEERVLSDRSMRGVALRYGFFYGPERIMTERKEASPRRSGTSRIR